jgi:hypothetical protein
MRQAQAWQSDAFLRELRSAYRHEQLTNPISPDWVPGCVPALEFS